MVAINFKISILGMALAFDLAAAHVSLSPKFTEPGKNLSTAFHIPHGCSGSSTIAVTAMIPDKITSVSAGPVSNWTVSTNYRDSSNATVTNITWTGGYLKATDALDFPITLTFPTVDLSTQPNVTYYFPVIQTCENSTLNWTDIPAGPSSAEAKHPAPVVVIVKNATEAAAGSTAINSSNDHSGHSGQTSGASQFILGSLPAVATIGAIAMLF
ncbi:hypothetical protein BY458DRAFT_501762 [Sporodiniella umbellata]|nr:hypothetical protein BY458DRAFT_501762 [Sporodiniella umbellata]